MAYPTRKAMYPTRKAKGLPTVARQQKIDEAYSAERSAARDISPLWLRHRYRQLLRQRPNDITRTQLAAVRAEFGARGLELPE